MGADEASDGLDDFGHAWEGVGVVKGGGVAERFIEVIDDEISFCADLRESDTDDSDGIEGIIRDVDSFGIDTTEDGESDSGLVFRVMSEEIDELILSFQ